MNYYHFMFVIFMNINNRYNKIWKKKDYKFQINVSLMVLITIKIKQYIF